MSSHVQSQDGDGSKAPIYFLQCSFQETSFLPIYVCRSKNKSWTTEHSNLKQGALRGSPKNKSIKYSLSEGLEKVPHVLKRKQWKCCCQRETASSYQSLYSQRLFLWAEEVGAGISQQFYSSETSPLRAPSHGHSASTATKVVPNWAPRMVSSTLKKRFANYLHIWHYMTLYINI